MEPPEGHHLLKSLREICRSFDYSRFFTATYLKTLGVKLAPVNISHESDTPELNFKPRFFQPHPDSLIAKHNLELPYWYPDRIHFYTRDHCPTTDEALAEAMQIYGNEFDGDISAEDWKYRHGEGIVTAKDPDPPDFMDTWHDYAERTCLGLDAFMNSLEYTEAWLRETRERAHLMEVPAQGSWFCSSIANIKPDPYRPRKHWDPLYPHARLLVYGDIEQSDIKSRLTLYELKAIYIALAAITKNLGAQIYPLLIFSFMAPNHARLMQVVYDGSRIDIQYSEIISLCLDDIPALELFLRYRAYEAISTEEALSNSMADMRAE